MSDQRIVQTKQDIAHLVERYIQNHTDGSLKIQLANTAIRQDDNWWYVPVRTDTEPLHTYQYYDVLTDIENDILDKEHINVLLVPSS